ncbi:sugar phosphate isomerase/epimerase family protein [Vagococcus elongatus]|uniref:Sugar phosphate isomerase n=1 Tax=Vagococcus elongatus TaxID=180344 RepID=A0A430B4J8_9ENTE|nr:TIM barrel protein [Vagococcus elongatus]RSU15244.1 sugar phosphate isomerase [Vagococcus elongatus]
MANNLVLNLLVFDDKRREGTLQADMILHGMTLGFKAFEIRREYFEDMTKEIPMIKKLVDEFSLDLFYSVPDEVFVDGKINPKLKDYLIEADQLGVKHIKWNIGDFAHFSGDINELKGLTQEGIAISVENDQTQTSGRIEPIDVFMGKVKENKISIGYVYDLGNWRFVGEDEHRAAELLNKYVTYIHVKDVKTIQGKPTAAGLGKGEIQWQKVLDILPRDVPIAIEYPTVSDEEILDAKELLEKEIEKNG